MARVKTGRYPATIRVPFTGGGSIVKDGTVVIPGTSQGTNLGLAIADAANTDWVDAVGLLKGDSVVANDSVQAGTTWTYAEVELFDSIDLVEIDWSQASADLVAVTSLSGTTLTITSLENNADCGWFYAVSGTGAGQLIFATAVNGGTATLKSTPSPAWDSTTKLIHIKRFGHKLHFTAVSSTKTLLLASQAAVGSVKFMTLENYIESQANGIPKQLLDPTKHSGITLKQLKVTFSTVGVARNTAGRN